MINFHAVDFSERRPEEVVSFDAQCILSSVESHKGAIPIEFVQR